MSSNRSKFNSQMVDDTKPDRGPEMVNGIQYTRGLRIVTPYYHSRTSFAKGRWLGRKLVDVLSDEFKSFSSEQYKQGSQKDFQIIRDGVPLSAAETSTTEIQNKDIIKTTFHKHEPPVRQWSSDENDTKNGGRIAGFEIVHECSDLLVLNKPCGVPIHPTGQYFRNSMVEALKAQGMNVFPTHRLDKVTSGILIMGKNPFTANKIQDRIRQRTMRKTYLARVEGRFPKTPDSIFPGDTNFPTASEACANESRATIEESQMYTIELKKQFPAAFSGARDAVTRFYPVKYFAECNQTLVACQPITGRTHQIRIHLARLGHPIVNDPFYNKNQTKFPKRLQFMLDVPNWNNNNVAAKSLESYFQEFVQESESSKGLQTASKQQVCNECDIVLYPDPQLRDLELFLHAWNYSDCSGELSYETSLPAWAL
ncbi:LAFA_0B01772g1_1 [Lachancea sp. 'fantastica']|nr:LAFA_0B01772g1_1 [Lachancea sp. 'fantastica']